MGQGGGGGGIFGGSPYEALTGRPGAIGAPAEPLGPIGMTPEGSLTYGGGPTNPNPTQIPLGGPTQIPLGGPGWTAPTGGKPIDPTGQGREPIPIGMTPEGSMTYGDNPQFYEPQAPQPATFGRAPTWGPEQMYGAITYRKGGLVMPLAKEMAKRKKGGPVPPWLFGGNGDGG